MEQVAALEARIIALERAVEILTRSLPTNNDPNCEVDPTGEWY